MRGNAGEISNDKKRCFVVMGFGKKTDFTDGRVLDLDASYLMIKSAVEAKGLICIRADEILHSGTIHLPAYRELLTADLVIADLSTYNPKALFELGIRYALRPSGTIVIAEEGFRNPFEVSHMVIRRYKHLGEDIGTVEARRFSQELGVIIQEYLKHQPIDSPVYTFIHELIPPLFGRHVDKAVAMVPAAKALEQTGQVIFGTVTVEEGKGIFSHVPGPGPQDITLAMFREQGEQAIKSGRFAEAASLFEQAQRLLSGGLDTYLIQRQVLATYKAERPNRVEALHLARRLLQELSPKESNDPETLHLLGDIELALFNETKDVDRLVRARQAYERLNVINQDCRTGITLAYLLSLHFEYCTDNTEKLSDINIANRFRREVVDQGKKALADMDTVARLTRTSKAAKADQRRFEIWCAISEAWYGLGEIENYREARNEAIVFGGMTSTVDTLDSRIKLLEPLLKRQAELSVAVRDYLGARAGLATSTSSASTPRASASRVESGLQKGGLPVRDLVFFSYSHKDVKWLDDFEKTLKPAFRNRPISLWDDRRIKPGQNWRDAIKDALSRARAAVLLVSRDFLDSEFIAEKELPDLLRDAAEGGVIVMWVAIEKTLYDEAEFERYQALNSPAKPLSSFKENELNPEIVSICEKIRDRIFPNRALASDGED